jgi:hypothetical protein
MPTKADYPTARLAWCAECDASPGLPCFSHQGRKRRYPHAARLRRARTLRRGTIQSPLRPGEDPPPEPSVLAEQLSLVGYDQEPDPDA